MNTLTQSNNYLVFQQRLSYFKLFNILAILWGTVQTTFYISIASISKCPPMVQMLVGFTLTQLVFLLCPIFSMIFASLHKYFTFAYLWFVFTGLCKITVIVVICVVAWQHVGKCYLGRVMKYMIIALNIGQILVLPILTIILRRVKRVYRSIKIDAIVNSKTFYQDQ